MLFALPKLSHARRWGIGLFTAATVLLGTTFSPCSLVALGVLCLFALAGDRADFTFLFVLTTPLATVFRPSPSAQSYLTLVLLLYALAAVLNALFIRQELDEISGLLALFFLSAVAVQLAARTLDWKRTLKLTANLILVKHSIRISREADCRDIFLGYLCGLVLASGAAFLKPGFLSIGNYVTSKTLSAGYGLGTMNRFSALYADPNYYGVNVIIGLCLLVVLYRKAWLPIFPLLALTGTLVFFGILTYSKSVTLMLLFPAVLLTVCAAQRRQYSFLRLLAAAAFLFLTAILTGNVPAFRVISVRFRAGDGSLNALTSGRTGLWLEYLQFIFGSPWRVLFGSGLGMGYLSTAKGDAAAHNFCIEAVYHLGLVGFGYLCVLLGVLRRSVQKNIRRNLLHGSVFVSIAIMYMALNQLFHFELPVHLIVANLVWNLDMEPDAR